MSIVSFCMRLVWSRILYTKKGGAMLILFAKSLNIRILKQKRSVNLTLPGNVQGITNEDKKPKTKTALPRQDNAGKNR